MTTHPKIAEQHLNRLAYIYIRQSTLRQTVEHLESQDLQYGLTHRAQALGWSESQILIIDQDLGKSAISSNRRYGFQQLVADVGLGKVGIILVTDVSRLARNCADWYQLLDLASLHDVLVCDASGVYNPRIYNDRLLLGMKGAFSEAQWYNMRQQMHAARLNKARRGELHLLLPVGYERLPNGDVIFTADQQVQQVIHQVFRLFRQVGSARGVLRQMRLQAIQMPYRTRNALGQWSIEWRAPTYHAVYQLLKGPVYAGVYAYGRHQSQERGTGSARKYGPELPPEEWEVLILDAHPAYISWEEYLQNRTTLHQNSQRYFVAREGAPGPGAAGKGRALLQGIVCCSRCGRRMAVRYREKPTYVCVAAHQELDLPRCQHFPHAHVDDAVVALFLAAIEPASLEIALCAQDEMHAERQALTHQWEQQLERARYEASVARLRYEQVDPTMRLVASELERAWEEKLQTLQQLEGEWGAIQEQNLRPLSAEDEEMIRTLAQDLPRLWYDEATTIPERKRLLRTLIQDVTLDSTVEEGITHIDIRWWNGASTHTSAPRPVPGHPNDPELMARVHMLAQTLTDDKIAEILNREGLVSFWQIKKIPDYRPGEPVSYWTRSRVHNLRNKHKIPTGCPLQTSASGPRADGLIAAHEAADLVGASVGSLLDWFRRGLIPGHQHHPGSPVWVAINEENRHRFDATLFKPWPDMVMLTDAPDSFGLSWDEIRAAIQRGEIESWRVPYGAQNRWFLRRA